MLVETVNDRCAKQLLDRAEHIAWQVRDKCHSLAVGRTDERKGDRVERVAVYHIRGRAVHVITEYRATEMCKVNSELMRPAGCGAG